MYKNPLLLECVIAVQKIIPTSTFTKIRSPIPDMLHAVGHAYKKANCFFFDNSSLRSCQKIGHIRLIGPRYVT
jgi:hypothetical protein